LNTLTRMPTIQTAPIKDGPLHPLFYESWTVRKVEEVPHEREVADGEIGPKRPSANSPTITTVKLAFRLARVQKYQQTLV
jgi:hypothetical protein